MHVRIGCDPELFVKNPNTGQFVTAHGMIPGTKHEPFKVPKGAVQVDGMALEFNIDPADTKEEFVGNVQTVMERMKAMVPGYNVVIEPTALFEKGYFDGCPEEAKMLGCDPDYNAYTGEVNEKPQTDEPFRTAAGHVHIGWLKPEEFADVSDSNHFEDCREVVKQLDYYLGCWSLTWDQDQKRRSLYGKAGCFRPKPYGVEYRTLSNAWLRSPELTGWVYDTTQYAVDQLFKGFRADKRKPGLAQHVIDNNLHGTNFSVMTPGLIAPPGTGWGAPDTRYFVNPLRKKAANED